MCYGHGVLVCSELGDDPDAWSHAAPLPPPRWFGEEFDKFVSAAQAVAHGNLTRGLAKLETVDGERLRFWFTEHGQHSGGFRARRLGVPQLEYVGPVRRPLTRLLARKVFLRDQYQCRYCGVRTLSGDFLQSFETALGTGRFSAAQHDNALDHGVAIAFRAVAHYVVPQHLGGRAAIGNLVTACPSCNDGKYHYTIEQLGIDDPARHPPADAAWDGLLSLVPLLASLPPSTAHH